MNEILKAERLSKTYGKTIAVSEVSLTVRQGDIYGLIGKNGAGKTTFMRMVLGLALPDSGQMELFGKTDLEQQRKHILCCCSLGFKLSMKMCFTLLCQRLPAMRVLPCDGMR